MLKKTEEVASVFTSDSIFTLPGTMPVLMVPFNYKMLQNYSENTITKCYKIIF
jgi:hypothetical protein